MLAKTKKHLLKKTTQAVYLYFSSDLFFKRLCQRLTNTPCCIHYFNISMASIKFYVLWHHRTAFFSFTHPYRFVCLPLLHITLTTSLRFYKESKRLWKWFITDYCWEVFLLLSVVCITKFTSITHCTRFCFAMFTDAACEMVTSAECVSYFQKHSINQIHLKKNKKPTTWNEQQPPHITVFSFTLRSMKQRKCVTPSNMIDITQMWRQNVQVCLYVCALITTNAEKYDVQVIWQDQKCAVTEIWCYS